MLTWRIRALVTRRVRRTVPLAHRLWRAAVGRRGAAANTVGSIVLEARIAICPRSVRSIDRGVRGSLTRFVGDFSRWRGRRHRAFAVWLRVTRSYCVDSGHDSRNRALITYATRIHRWSWRVVAAGIDWLVAIGICLAGSLGGWTVMRTLTASATRGASTFVHAAVVE
jgi:hypothetical protein